ncbi:MAG: aerobic carbon-monoxide dehydrogenase large subunit [Burkholderiales bacterium]|jgi:carbon-monoxide dehydrogenase large subunit
MDTHHVGQRSPRVEDPRLTTGRGRYIADIRLPNMLEAAFVRSSEAHARIISIDAEAALALPGVVAVLTMADFEGYADKRMPQPLLHPSIKTSPTQYPLAKDEVCYVGEAIAMVIAENRYIAEDAANLVMVEYESLPVVVDLRAASDDAAPRVNHQTDSNIVASIAARFGDSDAAFAAAPHIFKESYVQHRGGGHSMECRGVIASNDGGTGMLCIWTSSQTPHMVRRWVAEYLGRDENQTRVIVPDVGGGFGPKAGVYPEEYAVPLAALKLGRPVRWVEDRRENFVAANHQRDSLWELEVAADASGKILGIRGKVLVDAGAYLPYGIVLSLTSLHPFPGPYSIPAINVGLDVVLTNATPTSVVRGAGRPNVAFVLERLVDLVARKLTLDRAEVRRRNFIKKHEFPYATGAILPSGDSVVFDSGDYEAALDLVLRSSDYANFPARREAARKQGRYLGLGIASYNEDTGMGPYEGATVRVLPSGRIVVQTGTSSQGQGHATTLAQVCADQLGVPLEQVCVEAGDTGVFPLGIGAVGSRMAVVAGSAVHLAAKQVREKAFKLAAKMLDAAEGDLELVAGTVRLKHAPDKGLTLAQLAKRMAGSLAIPLPPGFTPGLEATAFHNVTLPTYANGTNVAEVEVDIETGQVNLVNYFVAHDCGRLINPMLVDGQIIGGVVHGIGNALFERMMYDESGQPITMNYGEYLLPTAPEMPPIHVEHVETLSPINPLGAKGAGEGGTIPATAAIISALENALAHTGVRICEYPVSPQQLLDLIGESQI